MEDDFGGEVVDGAVEGGGVADVAANVLDFFVEAGGSEEAGGGVGVEGVAADVGSEMREPEGEPAALEAGVAGEEDTLVLPGERRLVGHVVRILGSG